MNVGTKLWKRRAFAGVKPRPHLNRMHLAGKISAEERDLLKLKGSLKRQLEKQLAKGEITQAQFDLAEDFVRRVATCSAAWGDAVFDEGVRYPPEPGPNLHASRMWQCKGRGCGAFIPDDGRGRKDLCDVCTINRASEMLMDGDEAVPGPALTAVGSRSITTIYQHPKVDRGMLRTEGRRRQRRSVREEVPTC